jgi:hypothetical protein
MRFHFSIRVEVEVKNSVHVQKQILINHLQKLSFGNGGIFWYVLVWNPLRKDFYFYKLASSVLKGREKKLPNHL